MGQTINKGSQSSSSATTAQGETRQLGTCKEGDESLLRMLPNKELRSELLDLEEEALIELIQKDELVVFEEFAVFILVAAWAHRRIVEDEEGEKEEGCTGPTSTRKGKQKAGPENENYAIPFGLDAATKYDFMEDTSKDPQPEDRFTSQEYIDKMKRRIVPFIPHLRFGLLEPQQLFELEAFLPHDLMHQICRALVVYAGLEIPSELRPFWRARDCTTFAIGDFSAKYPGWRLIVDFVEFKRLEPRLRQCYDKMHGLPLLGPFQNTYWCVCLGVGAGVSVLAYKGTALGAFNYTTNVHMWNTSMADNYYKLGPATGFDTWPAEGVARHPTNSPSGGHPNGLFVRTSGSS